MKITTLAIFNSIVACSAVTAGAAAHQKSPAHHQGKYKPTFPHHWGPPGKKPGKPWKHHGEKSLVTPEALMDLIKLEGLVAGAEQLQAFSDAYWQKNRVFGGPAHMDTVNYLYDQITALGYYDVYLQEQVHPWSDSNQTLSVGGVVYKVSGATYGPSGDVSAPLVSVSNLGCEAANYPAEVAGKVALISRGTCPFGDKVALAGAAGAVGAVIYNNAPGVLAGTLGASSNPLGPYVPVVFVTKDDGATLSAELGTADIAVSAVSENRTTYNVIAQTKGGDAENVVALGAHTDSVNAGPGINDDGSGVIGILNVAKALTKFTLTNAVRFCFWTGEEYGLLGSEFYVASLNRTEADKIALYLNFDMIASPNYVYAIYDGDGSAFNISGPTGSAQIETLFETFYAERNLPSLPTEFNGRSDYGPFLDVGIPSGGIFTGAEKNKTVEEVALFGGQAGVALDACYHAACDNITNLALDAFELNTKAIAYSVATYANSLDGFPRNNVTIAKRTVKENNAPRHGCSCNHEIHEL